ncbi:MAG: hypothetical protein IJV87_02100 [Clostridia bacterium]|nr:hypothetical protein [Clostridia bacterium]
MRENAGEEGIFLKEKPLLPCTPPPQRTSINIFCFYGKEYLQTVCFWRDYEKRKKEKGRAGQDV